MPENKHKWALDSVFFCQFSFTYGYTNSGSSDGKAARGPTGRSDVILN